VAAVELCEERLDALRDPRREKLGLPSASGFLPWLLAVLEKALGSLSEVFPGSEMLEAVQEAERVGANVVLIDRPIRLVLQDMKRIPSVEKARIGLDVLRALFTISTKRNATRLNGSLDGLMAEFDAEYPTLSRILVKERDEYMAIKIGEILNSTQGKIVAVVGLGHVRGITQYLAQQRQSLASNHCGTKYSWTLETRRQLA
jgi:pheromone shutdown protein TraB